MRPEWFSVQKELLPPTKTNVHVSTSEDTGTEGPEPELPIIPLKEMWADDEFWMPLMFSRRFFVGRADFDANRKMLKWWFAAAPSPS